MNKRMSMMERTNMYKNTIGASSFFLYASVKMVVMNEEAARQ